jgi:hypothetical protein
LRAWRLGENRRTVYLGKVPDKEADTIRRRIESILSWKQVVANLKEFMPEGIRINQLTAGHAIEFHEKLKARGMARTKIHKRIQFESLSRFS